MSSSSVPRNIAAIFGVPRSGTSWLGQILNSSPDVAFRFQPLFSYEFKDRLDKDSSTDQINRFYADLMRAQSDFVLQTKNLSGNDSDTFDKSEVASHLVWKEVRYINILPTLLENSDTKLLLVIRHPAAVINSWLRAPKEFDPAWDAASEWHNAEIKNAGRPEEFNGYEKWKEAVTIFVHLADNYPERVRLVKYEDLVRDPTAISKELFAFLEIPYTQQTQKFILSSTGTQSDDPYGVHRANTDSERWKKELSSDIQAAIENDLNSFSLNSRLGY